MGKIVNKIKGFMYPTGTFVAGMVALAIVETVVPAVDKAIKTVGDTVKSTFRRVGGGV